MTCPHEATPRRLGKPQLLRGIGERPRTDLWQGDDPCHRRDTARRPCVCRKGARLVNDIQWQEVDLRSPVSDDLTAGSDRLLTARRGHAGYIGE